MKKTSLIGHVLEVLELIRSHTHPADSVLADFFRRRHYLGSKDRRFIAEALFGILRNHILLETAVEETHEPQRSGGHVAPANPLELYTAYARLVLREDRPAILGDLVSLWPDSGRGVSAAQFLDALETLVLPPVGADPVRRLSVAHSIPETIVHEWIERFGMAEAEGLCAASNQPAATTIRVNTLRCSVEECQAMLGKEGVRTTRTSLSPAALVLEKRVNIQSLRTFRGGAFEIQDEGSQLLSLLMEPARGGQVVDACAGAGGKTLHLAALMGNKGSILAIDSDRRRLEILRERAARAGATIVQLCEAGDSRIAEWKDRADAVLVDAPCTGVGTYRRNPGAKMTFERQSLSEAAERQVAILKEYARLVKPGGRVVYATCSLLREENEDVVGRFLQDHPAFHAIAASEILSRQGVFLSFSSPFLTLLPHRTGTDGFFGAVLERK